MIQLTEKAASKIKEFAESEGLGLFVRITVLAGGCSGFTFDMNFDENISDTDETIKQGDITLVVDQLSFQYMDGVSCDYIESPFGGGFKFREGEISGSCACGSSYSF